MNRRTRFIKILMVLVLVFIVVVACRSPSKTPYLVGGKGTTIRVGRFDYKMYEYEDKGGTFYFFVRYDKLEGVTFVPFE